MAEEGGVEDLELIASDQIRNERSQASKKVMMQPLDGTRDLEEGSELGSITAEVDEA